jgi:hypothetical protein
MANKRVSVDFDFNGVTFRIQGAEYFYNDAGIRGNIGADLTDDNDLGGKVVIDKKIMYQRVLVPLVAVLKASNPANIGSSAQSSNVRYFKFWCNPTQVGECFDDLPGTDIDANLLPGDWKVQKVMVPVDSNVA